MLGGWAPSVSVVKRARAWPQSPAAAAAPPQARARACARARSLRACVYVLTCMLTCNAKLPNIFHSSQKTYTNCRGLKPSGLSWGKQPLQSVRPCAPKQSVPTATEDSSIHSRSVSLNPWLYLVCLVLGAGEAEGRRLYPLRTRVTDYTAAVPMADVADLLEIVALPEGGGVKQQTAALSPRQASALSPRPAFPVSPRESAAKESFERGSPRHQGATGWGSLLPERRRRRVLYLAILTVIAVLGLGLNTGRIVVGLHHSTQQTRTSTGELQLSSLPISPDVLLFVLSQVCLVVFFSGT